MIGVSKLKQLYTNSKHAFSTDSLFRNAAYLMASTAIMSVLGFGFWIFVARLYSSSQIGLASALIAISTLISNLSMLGMNSGLVRFLPGSKNQSKDINATLLIVGATTALVSLGYLIIQVVSGNTINPFASNPWQWPLFIGLMICVSLNSLTDSVFIANRRAEFHTLAYAAFGIVRLILPIFLITLGEMGIFYAYSAAVVVSLALSYIFMRRNWSYRISAAPNWPLIKNIRAYATHNYLAVMLAGVPAQLMPVIVIMQLNESNAAYFSIAWTMANLLYVIPSAISQSLLAESSHNEHERDLLILRSSKILGAILFPVVAIAVVTAPVLMKLFGAEYSSNSTLLFQVLAFATFSVALNSLGTVNLNIRKQTRGIVTAQAVATAITLGTAGYFLKFGVIGAGLALGAGYLGSNIIHVWLYLALRKRDKKISADALANPRLSERTISEILKKYGVDTYESINRMTPDAPNKTIIISTKSSRRVLRVYRYGTELSKVRKELDFMSYLASNSIPVPKIIKNTDGNDITLINIKGDERLATLTEFESGIHPSDYDNTGLLRNMATTQAKIHELGIKFANQNKATPVSSLRRNPLSPLNYTPKGYSHFDFDASNILTDKSSISCVLDFEGARYDALVVCTYFTLKRIYDTHKSTALLQNYIKDYQTVRKLNRAERMILNIALLINTKSFTAFKGI